MDAYREPDGHVGARDPGAVGRPPGTATRRGPEGGREAGHRLTFTCNGEPVDVELDEGTTLLDVLRERLGWRSVKDGCAPQGQCGCCTVLIDGEARVACVTPATRVGGRAVTTLEGLDPRVVDRLVKAFVATGASQCGFCTPGILMRVAALLGKSRTTNADLGRALGAHLCRCTGWQTMFEAVEMLSLPDVPLSARRDLVAATRRAFLEGGVAQRVGPDIAVGQGGFADDTAPADALVAIPLPPGSAPNASTREAAGLHFVVATSVHEARRLADKIQGRRSTATPAPPFAPLPAPHGGVALATTWVEPAYLEPDASWCWPGGDPASPLANGGAFGGKTASPVVAAARTLAERLQRPVRVLFAREDCVRLGPKRPPISATAVFDGTRVRIEGVAARERLEASWTLPYALEVQESWNTRDVVGPPTSPSLRAFPLAERTVLIEGALEHAGASRTDLVADARAAEVLLDACARHAAGATAGARVVMDLGTGAVQHIEVRVAAGDPLDEVTLRSYCIGAVHMALGWVLTEGITVDPVTGELLDLTIRSFGIVPARAMPPVQVTIADDAGPPLPGASDAVFAAVAAATWNAVTHAEGSRPLTFPARKTRAAAMLRR